MVAFMSGSPLGLRRRGLLRKKSERNGIRGRKAIVIRSACFSFGPRDTNLGLNDHLSLVFAMSRRDFWN